jgi:transglutaminase-like putative cysteine protease
MLRPAMTPPLATLPVITGGVMTLPRAATLACLASFALGVLLHADRLPLWCAGLALCATLWRAGQAYRPALRLPGRAVRIALALLVVAGVLIKFRTLNGLVAGTALLVVMGALKLLETSARRDHLIMVNVALVLLLAACLDRQDLVRVPVYVGALVAACTALALVATPSASFGPMQALRLTGRALASALPLAIVLFLLFPRIAGSFWALPATDTTRTGLGEEMTPGDIDALTESDEPVFRVRFSGARPPPAQRYWRGPVMHRFDGATWRPVIDRAALGSPLPLEARGDAYTYQITLEPEKHPWLFALEKPVNPSVPGVFAAFDDQLLTVRPVTQASTFALTSYSAARTTAELPARIRALDSIPPPHNPRARELALELRSRAASDAAFVDAVLELFRSGGFEYTLTPPKLDHNSIDDFLFNTKRGFCGHYASAFVALMRAGGVPAHVVTGYLGGEWNPLGGYYIVRQSDAHAWAEVWFEGRGWTRVDPTGVVAPERLNRSLFEFMPESMGAAERLVRSNAWVSQLRFAWDTADNWWRDQIQHYDFRKQTALLERLGFVEPDARLLAAGMSIALALWLIWFGWQSRRSLRTEPTAPVARAYARLCAKLARAGLARAAHEGPMHYAARIAALRPELATEIDELCSSYARLRFGRPSSARDVRPLEEAFRRAVARFRVPRPATESLQPRAAQ